MVIVEGPEAGGHLGFSKEELAKNEFRPLEELVTEVIEAMKPFEEKYKIQVPVIGAGGIYSERTLQSLLS